MTPESILRLLISETLLIESSDLSSAVEEMRDRRFRIAVDRSDTGMVVLTLRNRRDDVLGTLKAEEPSGEYLGAETPEDRIMTVTHALLDDNLRGKKLGALMYEVMLEIVSSRLGRFLSADRLAVEPAAERIWAHWLNRSDLQKMPLDDLKDTRTPEIADDNYKVPTVGGKQLGSGLRGGKKLKAAYEGSGLMQAFKKAGGTPTIDELGRLVSWDTVSPRAPESRPFRRPPSHDMDQPRRTPTDAELRRRADLVARINAKARGGK